MAATKNSYLSDLLLNYVLGTTPPAISSIKAVLTTNIPNRNDTNDTLVRPSYDTYADTTILNTNFSGISENLTGGSTMTSIGDITFPSPSAAPGSAIIVNGFAIIDNNNHVLYQSGLSLPLSITTSGQTVKIAGGSLAIIEV